MEKEGGHHDAQQHGDLKGDSRKGRSFARLKGKGKGKGKLKGKCSLIVPVKGF